MLPDHPKFSRPTDAVGDWTVSRSACFEQSQPPPRVKYAIEKMTCQLLRRETLAGRSPVLRYAGTSGAGGHPSTVKLELIAIDPERRCHLYRLTSESSAPRRWEQEQRFTADCERRFAHWCGQLRIVTSEHAWPNVPRAAFERYVMDVAAAEDAAARIEEDMVPVVELQRQVLAALRGGWGFLTSSKEGGSRLFFDGEVFRRSDYGDGPDMSTVYSDESAMLDGLRRIYSWDAQQDSYPHAKPELDVWRYIHGKLRKF